MQQEVDRLAEAGERVLLFAARDDPPADRLDDDAVGELRLLGLQGLIDPPRPEAVEAVDACRRAGVRVVMVTGDHPRTARAVARTLGISEGGALTGSEIEQLDERSLRRAARRVSVYARAAPKDKLKLVRALQADGEVVAVTGDGVNDAPALRQSALGVAMGRTGTATAKESADMVLADDNFATLRAAIEEGRRVYDNLVKALAFVLPTSMGQALIIAVAVLAFPLRGGDPQLPVEPVQILWINLIVAVALALPLALEAPEPDLMERPPRRPGTPLLDRPLLVRTVAVAVTLTVVDPRGVRARARPPAGRRGERHSSRWHARRRPPSRPPSSSRRSTCSPAGHSHGPIARSDAGRIRPSTPASSAVLVLQAAFVALPPMHDAFGSARLDLQALALAFGASLLVFPVTWVEERWRVHRASPTQIAATTPRDTGRTRL